MIYLIFHFSHISTKIPENINLHVAHSAEMTSVTHKQKLVRQFRHFTAQIINSFCKNTSLTFKPLERWPADTSGAVSAIFICFYKLRYVLNDYCSNQHYATSAVDRVVVILNSAHSSTEGLGPVSVPRPHEVRSTVQRPFNELSKSAY